MRAKLLFPFLVLPALTAPSRANDSISERALGGLSFVKSDAISMDSEDLYISRDRVRVNYVFTNTSDQPVEATVAFAMPDIEFGEVDGEGKEIWRDIKKDLDFKTRIDGQAAMLDIVEQAIVKGKDISARVSALGLPLNGLAEDFSTRVNKLPKAEREKLVAEKLIEDGGMSNEPLWNALWTLRTTVTRRQTFPAKASVTVAHEYKPLAGGSVGGGLDPQYRKGEYAKDFSDKRRDYCIEDDWLRSFDRRLKSPPKSSKGADLPYSEVWLGYVLKTGANWKGPIKDFRLIVDKGKPESLVSFCAEGVKKISPTQFEVRKTDFVPKEDLKILIVDWR